MSDIKVLVVDDVEANRVSLQYLINEYMDNVDLILSSSGEEALKISYMNKIDIIILDIQMPGLDGFETAKYLKTNPRTKNIPIIFLTAAYKEEEFKLKGLEIGAIDYLTKPIENQQFINKLKLYSEIVKKTRQLELVNDNLYNALQNEIKLKKAIEKQQLELIEQSKMAALGEMIGNIAHQWRQPLSIISTCASGLQLKMELGLDSKDETEAYLKRIMNATFDLSNTIETFRDFNLDDKLVEFNLNTLVDKCLETQSFLGESSKINIVKNLENNLILNTLQNSLYQVFVNILINAREALNEKTIDKKYIFITSKKDDDQIIITIKDNAGGIKTENLNKIFEPYFTTKKQSHGIGLGLNIVYKIMNELMNGKIKVKNTKYTYKENDYEGAEFTITIPVSL